MSFFFITVVLGKSHYVLFNLVSAMQPRMLVTLDEDLRPLPVSVRVGQVTIVFKFQFTITIIIQYCKYFYFNCFTHFWANNIHENKIHPSK